MAPGRKGRADVLRMEPLTLRSMLQAASSVLGHLGSSNAEAMLSAVGGSHAHAACSIISLLHRSLDLAQL